MDILLLFKALLLGIVEGLTEFLPISSTGHLIIAGDLLNFNNEVGKVFEIAIQSGAILAICYEYRSLLAKVILSLANSSQSRRFVINLFIAFMPAAILGALFINIIKIYLFQPFSVAIAFIIGGIIIFFVEKKSFTSRIDNINDMSWKDSLKVGLAQIFSLIPGTSRAGATIIGGMIFGLSRRVATEFSFFLAIPVISCATLYDLYKHSHLLSANDISLFTTGFIAAFISAFVAIRVLLNYIAHHNFIPFAWYRILFGIALLIYYRGALFQAIS